MNSDKLLQLILDLDAESRYYQGEFCTLEFKAPASPLSCRPFFKTETVFFDIKEEAFATLTEELIELEKEFSQLGIEVDLTAEAPF